MKRFVDRNHQYIDSINYGTGENTLAESWFHLIQYVRQVYVDIRQGVTTNGYLAPSLKNRSDKQSVLDSLDEVDVSLDFCEPKRHAAFRAHPHAYDWALDTIELCRGAGLTTTIVIMGTDETLQIDNVSRLFQLAKEYGCYVRINIYRINGNRALKPLSYEILRKTLLYIIESHVTVSLCDPLVSAVVLRTAVSDPSGTTSLRILPDGSITPSTYLVDPKYKRSHIQMASLQTASFRAALSRDIRSDRYPEECRGCGLKTLCKGGAIDRRIIWYGTIGERDPYCPFRHGSSPADWDIRGKIRRARGPEIHDGYLPTLIFCPDRLHAIGAARRAGSCDVSPADSLEG